VTPNASFQNQLDTPATFAIHFRIPGWCEGITNHQWPTCPIRKTAGLVKKSTANGKMEMR